MDITVIGCGYLGAVHAACLARLGHRVVGVDVDPAKVASLAAGVPPFHEPGLTDLLAQALDSGRLRFTTDIAAARGATVHFLCVGTPQVPGSGRADLRHLDAAFASLLPELADGDLVVGKSTVPVGTAAALTVRLAARVPGARLAWNPEFLREGFAVADTLRPDRLVYGLAGGDDPMAAARLDAVYADALAAGTPVVRGDLATAELVKAAANAFLATKISFVNAMAEVCEASGADVTVLAEALGHDERIGRRFLGAGVGFGGGCLPKDIRAFVARADEIGAPEAVGFLREVDAINLRRRQRALDLAEQACGGDLRGRRVAVLGAAFKPDSDDIRDSPALDVAVRLHAAGADVVVADPVAAANAAARFPELAVTARADEALADAEVVLLLTEWPQYRGLDPVEAGRLVRERQVVDGRNVLDRATWSAAGWTVHGLGRPTTLPSAAPDRALVGVAD